MPRLLMTVPEAAEALAISRSKPYELITSGTIASIRIDGSRRIPLAALEDTSPGCSPKGPPPDVSRQAQAPRWHHETRYHLVLRDPRQGLRDRRQQATMGRWLRHRAGRQSRPRRGPGEGQARRVHRPEPDHRRGLPGRQARRPRDGDQAADPG